MPRCQLESFISKRALPSQNRTESPPFPETLVPPRPRSHPNSANWLLNRTTLGCYAFSWPVSFLHFECVSIGKLIASRWGSALSFHLRIVQPRQAVPRLL